MHALAGLNSAASVYNAAQSLQAADTAKAQALLEGKPEPANTEPHRVSRRPVGLSQTGLV